VEEQAVGPQRDDQPEGASHPRRRLDRGRLAEVVGAIPPGRWMSYGDVAALAGGSPASARAVNRSLRALGCAGAHRVLKSDGTIAPTALGDPEQVLLTLVEEGVSFDELYRADQAQRVSAA
jgi:alkylated DNA nucleotide flippase Atl1